MAKLKMKADKTGYEADTNWNTYEVVAGKCAGVEIAT
jgi:hypothetical protein